MGVEEAFLDFWYTVSAPVDLHEFRETAVGVFNADKGVLDPPVRKFLLQLFKSIRPRSLYLEIITPLLIREHHPVDPAMRVDDSLVGL